jgi:hypothetical protein
VRRDGAINSIIFKSYVFKYRRNNEEMILTTSESKRELLFIRVLHSVVVFLFRGTTEFQPWSLYRKDVLSAFSRQ